MKKYLALFLALATTTLSAKTILFDIHGALLLENISFTLQ